MVVLEEWEAASARGANILAELIGYGLATDVAHLTHPSVDGQSCAMQLALRSAEIDAAALRILKLASPFEPFPPALARHYGSVRFAYQWEFSGGELQTGTVTAGADRP